MTDSRTVVVVSFSYGSRKYFPDDHCAKSLLIFVLSVSDNPPNLTVLKDYRVYFSLAAGPAPGQV